MAKKAKTKAKVAARPATGSKKTKKAIVVKSAKARKPHCEEAAREAARRSTS